MVEIGYEGQPSSRHLLRTGRYAVGSAEAADLQVRCSGVSRRHLQLDVLADGGLVGSIHAQISGRPQSGNIR